MSHLEELAAAPPDSSLRDPSEGYMARRENSGNPGGADYAIERRGTVTTLPSSESRRLIFARDDRDSRGNRFSTAIRQAGFGLAQFDVGRGHRPWRAMLVCVAICVHYTKIMLGVLVEVFGRDPIAARRRFTRQRQITFKYLISVSTYFDIWAIAVECLNSMRKPRPIVMRIITIITTARSLVWAWSHDTYLI
jgi:hypothetical protein